MVVKYKMYIIAIAIMPILLFSCSKNDNINMQGAIPVTFTELLSGQAKFKNAHIVVTGYVLMDFESVELYQDEYSARCGGPLKSVWLNIWEQNGATIQMLSNGYYSIEGMFQCGPEKYGHMRGWESQIVRIKTIVPTKAPDSTTAIPLINLTGVVPSVTSGH